MQTLLFQPHEYYNPKWYIFKETPLGKIYQTIPWEELRTCLPEENDGPGAPRWFTNKGMLGLMFLKAYLSVSDEKLVERFNTDWSLQLFCGKLLQDSEQIRDKAIVSRIRTYISENGFLAKDFRKIVSIEEGNSITDAVLLEEGKGIIYATDDRVIYKASIDGKTIIERPIFDYPNKLILAPGENYLAVLTLQGNVFLMNKNLDLIYKFPYQAYANTVNNGYFKKDGTELIVSSWAGLGIVWKTPKGIKKIMSRDKSLFYKLTEEERLNYGLIQR